MRIRSCTNCSASPASVCSPPPPCERPSSTSSASLRPIPRQLARPHRPRILLRRATPLGAHQQARRCLPAHAADPRRTLRAQCRHRRRHDAAAHSIDCAPGPSTPSGAAATTKPPSPSPTSWLASSGPPGSISAPSTAIGPRTAATLKLAASPPTGCTTQIALMTSGTAAGAVKPITMLALKAVRNDWLRAGDFHDVQGSNTAAHQQDEYTLAAVSRLRSEICFNLLAGGVHTRVVRRRVPSVLQCMT